MQFVGTELNGVYVVELEEKDDERGFFARAFCADEFAERGLEFEMIQSNISFNHTKGTIRGLHLQCPPAVEAKLFRCTRGATYHVAVDMRPASDTYGAHIGIELSAENRKSLFIPEMCAAGYQTLTEGAEVFYMTSAPYTPSCEQGLRYDDPGVGVAWPLEASVVSEKDLQWPPAVIARRLEGFVK